MNVCVFAGNLGADPELRMTSNGTAVLNLRIAVNERIKKGDEWQDHVEWVPVVVWGKRGEGLSKILEKGSSVVVTGKYRTRSYDKDGNKRYTTEIVADDIKPMGGRRAEGKQDNKSQSKPSQKVAPQQEFPDDDEIPF